MRQAFLTVVYSQVMLADLAHVLVRLQQASCMYMFRIFRVTADEQAEAVRSFLRPDEQVFHRLAIARGSGSDKSRILALCSDIDCTGRS